MSVNKSVLLQKQVRENTEDLRTYLKDLLKWEEEMKRKESELSGENNTTPQMPNKYQKNDEKKKGKGKSKSKGKISGNDYAEWNKFDAELECEKVDEKKVESDSSNDTAVEEDRWRLRDEAVFMKERGNRFARQQNWDSAIADYTHAIACDPNDPIFFANRALCFLKKKEFQSAEADCTSALQLDPTYVKALQRRAAAKAALKQIPDAIDDLKRVVQLEPHNKESRTELQKLKKLDNRQTEVGKVEKYVSASTKGPVKKDSLVQPSTSKTVFQPEPSTSKLLPSPESKIPWPDRQPATPITPIEKLPHQRSKNPLRRIEITKSNTNDVEITQHKEKETSEPLSNLNYSDFDALATILAQSKEDVDEVLNKIYQQSASSKPVATDNKASTSGTTDPCDSSATFNFQPPKWTFQFDSDWNKMKNQPEHRYLYLKQIDPAEFPNLFQGYLESGVLSDIVHTLKDYFLTNSLDVYSYLLYLSAVKRFSTLIMFLSQKDKAALDVLFEYCITKTNIPVEEVNMLKSKYEL